MVSRIEIAKKEKMSVKEVHQKAEALNKVYFLDVFKSGNDNKWHGAIWQKQDCAKCRQEECKCVRLVYAFQDGFNRPHQAACDLNARVDAIQLTPAEERASGLKSSDLALLKKLEIRPSDRENAKAFQIQKKMERTLY